MTDSLPCNCGQHQSLIVTTSHHSYDLIEESDRVGSWWTWSCSCGGRGKRTAQSSSEAYHGWLTHLGRLGIWTAAHRRPSVKD